MANIQSQSDASTVPDLRSGRPARSVGLTLNVYTPFGGQVTVLLKRESDHAVLGVNDTGVGIDSDDLPHIFERFHRGRAARAAREDGAGLGLAIAVWIVEEHGGQIAVSSETGRGSSFMIRLPAVSPQYACTDPKDDADKYPC